MTTDYTQLLIDVQKKSNITISNVRDIAYLKEDIEAETSMIIGYNTLRRLFGFLKSTKPSLVTLNTLAVYLGFRSYTAYRNQYMNFDEWYFQQNLQRMLKLNTLCEAEFIQIRTGLLNSQNVLFLGYFITTLIERNRLSMVVALFKHIDFKTVLITDFLKFSTLLSLSLSTQSKKKAFQFYEALLPFEAFRNNVPLLFIDYDNLTTRYMSVLNNVKAYTSNTADLLFVSLMDFYRLFYSHQSVNHIDIEKPKVINSLYPVLHGRYYSYLILKSDKVNNSVFNEILQTCKAQPISLFLAEIIPALIFKNDTSSLNQIFDLYYEDIFNADVWSSNTVNALNLIALASINCENENTKSARKNLELVALNKIELSYENYIALFYYLTALKISFKDHIKTENEVALNKIKSLIKINGFKKFLVASAQYTIN